MSRPIKRSLTLNGHQTSASIEDEFWIAFKNIAAGENMGINKLASEIDAARGDIGLATAIRLFVLRNLQEKLDHHQGD